VSTAETAAEIARLIRGSRAEAADLMRSHLSGAATAKIEKLDHAGAWSGIKPTP
jgi:hypothetical protein